MQRREWQDRGMVRSASTAAGRVRVRSARPRRKGRPEGFDGVAADTITDMNPSGMHDGAHGPTRERTWRCRHVLRAVAALAALGVAGCAADGGSSAPRDGTAVYAQHCASCHGPALEGSSTGPPLLSIVYEPGHHPDESFRSAIRNGVSAHHWDFGPMPIVRGLSDAEVDAVIAHVRSVQESEGFLPYEP